MTDENKLDAYGHLTWTVGNEDWITCFDARRVSAGIEYHVIVDCESGGFTDTIEHNTVPATAEGIANLLCFPSYYADICSEHYIDVPNDKYGPIEWQETEASWRRHLEFLLTVEPDDEAGDDEAAQAAEEQSLDYFNRYIAGDR
jgi:hypothetical protein